MYNVRISGSKTPLEGFADTFVCVKEEEMKPGEFEYVHRVMISGKETVYNNVGWVVDGDCAACMRCHKTFGMMQWKHSPGCPSHVNVSKLLTLLSSARRRLRLRF